MKDYLDIVYSRSDKPLTSYPEQLVDYILSQVGIKKNSGLSLLEPGVGVGDHLRIFRKRGFVVRGLDVSERSKEMSPDLEIDVIDADVKRWPYEDCSFDVVYSKSFIEHLTDPELFLFEAFRVLRPGGIIVTLTPDWVANYKKFFDDYTHKSPFTKTSLRNIKVAAGFEDVNSFTFRQLPSTWHNPFLNQFCALIAIFVPYQTKFKFFRWSRELMLMGHGTKPNG
ncbi:MAG: class I SAM-dependent methyltransferase [Litorivicinaceae bacterium]|nr:class I SAM-dependent methyltransferase [Litorivicinaceae bacterium]